MRAIRYQGPNRFAIVDRPASYPGAGEARIEVISAGMCGTDVRIFTGEHAAYTDNPERVPGHEIVGRLAELGPGAAPPGAGPGDLVFVAPNIGCGVCAHCSAGRENLCARADALGITLDGGFADEVIVPARAVASGNLIRLPDSADPAASTLIEPLACVLRGQEKVGLAAGDSALVTGAGPVGLLHIALAVHRGATQVICSEPSPARRAAARRAGATAVIDPGDGDLAAAARTLTDGAGPDVVITAAPVHALQAAALHAAAAGGRVLLFAGLPRSAPTVELDTNQIHYKELTVAGTTASSLEDCRRAAQLVTELGPMFSWMISDALPLAEAERAIALVRRSSAVKVILEPARQLTREGGSRE
jgi:L-iditol 2-dehydrogenase